MKASTILRLLAGAVSALAANAGWAQIVECIDARGVKEYARFCPPGTVQERQRGKPAENDNEPVPTPAAPATAPKSIETQDVEFKKRMLERQEAEAKAAQDKAQAEAAERNCAEARAQLQAVLEGQRMSRFDPATGERVLFGEQELADEAARQRKAVAQWCK